MATTYTTNYNLGKQENHADKFDMDVITDNADKIDAALTAKADKSTTYTKTEVDTALSGKQATLTTAQLDAVNSGITSADVTQIGVNENNILSLTAALSPSTFQTVTPTIDNYVQIDGGGYARIGNLVIVQIRATWLQSCSEGLAIIRGLPKPLLNYDVYTAGASVVNNLHKNMSVMGNGTIAWVDGASPSSGGLVLSAVYICKD